MKVCHLIWSLTTGGTETMLVDIVNEQCKTDNISLVIINDLINSELRKKINSAVKVYCCNRKTGTRNPWALLKMNWYIAAIIKPDIVHCHMDKLGCFMKVPIKMVRTLHSTMCKNVDWKKYDAIFCISKSVKADAKKKGYPNGIVVYNGIHTCDIKTKSSFNITSPIIRFVEVGRFTTIKGQQLVIEAVNILVNIEHRVGFMIDFIGNGETLDAIRSRVVELGLEKYVNFLGEKSRTFFYPRLCEYDCYIQPSLSEGFGLTIVEAMCAKLPVIISNLEGPMEIIDNGKYGHYFQVGDAQDLAREMATFLDKGYNIKQIEKGYLYARQNFDVVNTAHRYLDEYENIV